MSDFRGGLAFYLVAGPPWSVATDIRDIISTLICFAAVSFGIILTILRLISGSSSIHVTVGQGPWVSVGFRFFVSFFLGYRPAFLPSWPYFRVCVLVVVRLSTASARELGARVNPGWGYLAAARHCVYLGCAYAGPTTAPPCTSFLWLHFGREF